MCLIRALCLLRALCNFRSAALWTGAEQQWEVCFIVLQETQPLLKGRATIKVRVICKAELGDRVGHHCEKPQN